MRSPKLDNLLGTLALNIDHDHRTLALSGNHSQSSRLALNERLGSDNSVDLTVLLPGDNSPISKMLQTVI
jgi:hypothetical protein